MNILLTVMDDNDMGMTITLSIIILIVYLSLYFPGSIWILPSFLSFTPIFLGIYTTQEYMERRRLDPELCDFVPNTGKP